MLAFYLTPASISYLNQFFLACVITVYLGWYLRKKRQGSSASEWLLLLVFSTVTIFSLALFLEASFLPTERLYVVYLLNTTLALMVVFLIQFAYSFSPPSSKQKIEQKLALLVSIAYLLWEVKIAIERFGLLRDGLVVFRPPDLDYVPVALFGWLIFVFSRGTIRNWRSPISRRFALIFLIPLVLTFLNRLLSEARISTPVYQIANSIGILVTIYLFALNYFVPQPESTSLVVKFSGALLTVMLSLHGVIAWLVTPAYAAQYRPSVLDHRSIRFTPNSIGGYDVSEIPFRFITDMGQKLKIEEAEGVNVSVQLTFDFPFFGQSYSQLFIGDDGLISFGTPIQYPSLEYRFSHIPILFALYLDLYPELNPSGGIYLLEESDRLIITYDHVPAFYYSQHEYTFQVVLYADGRIDLTYNGLPAGIQYQVNDRPNASIWVIGVKPGFAYGQAVSLAQLPITSGPTGVLDDQYRAFRKYIHTFLAPLAVAILASCALSLIGLPWLMFTVIAKPLRRLLEGVGQFDQDQKHRFIPIQHNDEIGFLTKSFNKMSRVIEDLVSNLELRVAERTTELLMANAELRKLSVAVEQSPSAIIITNSLSEIEYVNDAFVKSTGYTFEEVKGKNPRFLKSGQTPPETFREMWAALTGGKTWRGELINRRKNGEVYWEYTMIAPIQDVDGNITHYVAIKEDITDRKVVEAKLEQLAVTEPLTDLLNRRGFFLEAEKIYARSGYPPYALAVLMIDIDHFKNVNDLYGHQVGDAVLRELATRIRENLRPTDVVARYGGEEFVALIPRTTPDTLREIAYRLNVAISERPVECNGINVYVTISVGGAMMTAETQSLDELLTQADHAMYQAKAAGRNCVVIFNE